jgi:hypothetical protein
MVRGEELRDDKQQDRYDQAHQRTEIKAELPSKPAFTGMIIRAERIAVTSIPTYNPAMMLPP